MEFNPQFAQIIYFANVLVAGFVGICSLFFPNKAPSIVFQNTLKNGLALRLAGCFWTAIALLSLAGIFFPNKFVVFFIQLIYKSSFLVFIVLPALINKEYNLISTGISWFFLVWVLILPFVIPFQKIFS